MSKTDHCEKCWRQSPSFLKPDISGCVNTACECHVTPTKTWDTTTQERDCVFCDESKIKSEVTHHNPRVMSFEPLNPVVPGHRIFVPKKHVVDFFDDPDTFAEVCRVVSICASNHEEYNVITSKGRNATQSVFHLHVHLVPRTENDGLTLPWTSKEELLKQDRAYLAGEVEHIRAKMHNGEDCYGDIVALLAIINGSN